MSISSDLALAERQINLGNPRGAIEPLRRILAADPDHALAHAYLGICLHDTGELQEADDEIEDALRLAPEDGFIRYAAGLIALLQKDYGEAGTQLDEARRLIPWDARVYRSLARLYDETERVRLALSTLQEGLKIAPDDPGLKADIGSHLLESGHVDDAERMAEEALAIDPENCDALVLRGQVLLRRGDSAGAREHALLALRSDATHHGALHLICSAKFRRNPLLGLWWLYAVWITRIGRGLPFGMIIGSAIILRVFLFGIFMAYDSTLGRFVIVGWLIFVVYTWTAAGLFKRALRREIESVRLRIGF